jgi:hypothetical protein
MVADTRLFPFFLFGRFAIAMTKVENRAKKTFFPVTAVSALL